MRIANVFVNAIKAGTLEELPEGKFKFTYSPDYQGAPVSLTMPLTKEIYMYNRFPPFFEGLLPEGIMLEGFLRKCKLDRNDYFGQLLMVGQDVIGIVTIEGMK
jgi:serine/threonine-protein kinase HipA